MYMNKLILLFCTAMLSFGGSVRADTLPPGHVTGGISHSLPDWFKPSFLDFKDDMDDARKAGRQILVFMDLNDCPYCARTLKENFDHGDNKHYIQTNFDVIALNVQGDREVTWIDGAKYTEQDLAQKKLKVLGTPALIFLDPTDGQVLKLNGYRTPATLRLSLEYVHSRAYRHESMLAYTQKMEGRKTAAYTLIDDPRFVHMTDFAHYRKPLAVIFEDRDCVDCAGFHSKVLDHPDVQTELKQFQVVRLDDYATTPIVDISGSRTTPQAWAASLGLTYRPAVVLFNEGKEIARIQGRFYHFHFKEMLRFVSGEYYKRYDRFGSYLAVRQPELLRQGVNIDFGE
jgi:thioredoxin-related protein